MGDQHLYEPVQPSLGLHEFISYKEVKPALGVSKFAYCYWQLRTEQKLTFEFNYRVVADGCVDIFFNTLKPSESFVMGFYNKFHEFPLGTEFNYSGIRFNPSFFSQLFALDASLLSDKTTPLIGLNRELADFIDSKINYGSRLVGIKEHIDMFLGQWCIDARLMSDDRFENALRLIIEKKGLLDVETDLRTGLSPRQLRRIFNGYIGTSPKSFSKVIRFQSVIRQLQNSIGTKQATVYLDHGYFDQAHFIKDFKRFYGVTPRKAFF